MARIHSKNKGSNYEREIRKKLRKDLYPNCETARYSSKYADDVLKKDLVNTGFISIQAKATEKFPNFFDVLDSMPDDGNYNVVFNKRNRRGSIVVMREEDFFELLTIMKSSGIKI